MPSEYPDESHYETVTHENGTATLRHRESGQAMHSRVGPWEEAQLLYIEQSGMADVLQAESSDSYVIFDIGLGIAANALAAIELAQSLGSRPKRRLEIYSFESDPSGLAAGLAPEAAECFPFLARNREKALALLEQGEWKSPDDQIRWVLLSGQFQDHVAQAPLADVAFYDFYAPESCPGLWGVEAFERIKDSTRLLITYSAATPIRVAMLLAGFYVGYGKGTSHKLESTIAARDPSLLKKPLDARWLERFERSSRWAPYGLTASPELYEQTRKIIGERLERV